ncbi:MAG TPA: hypothetical protein VFJ05_00395 [Nitrososphaeraceae archaeon]|nr:hypothetical protein [Nitrososphaeraceae archaeon]
MSSKTRYPIVADKIVVFNHSPAMDKRCNTFAYKGRNDSNWAFRITLKFPQCQKERVEKKEIAPSTLRNYVKTME